MKPSEDQIKAMESQVATSKTVHDLIATVIEAEEELRAAKIEVAKKESKLAKAKMDQQQYELDALRAQIEMQEKAIREIRDPARIVKAVPSVMPSVMSPSTLVLK